MKCPKCGYVGFEPSDRCRHCGYDFSFAVMAPLPPPAMSTVALPVSRTPAPAVARGADSGEEIGVGIADIDLRVPSIEVSPVLADLPLADLPLADPGPPEPSPAVRQPVSDLFAEAPPPARPPLAVRRGAERPRSRPTTQVVRRPPASLLDVPLPAGATTSPAVAPDERREASHVARIAAGLVDTALLAGIGTMVVYLTVRLAGVTMAEVTVMPLVPLSAFLGGLALAYLVAFTACGGQTLGKMALGVRVVADDGAVPVGAATLRAVTALVGTALAGVGYLPAFFDGERRAVHDRVAGTRVVRA